MKKTLITISKILLGILSILIPFFIILFFVSYLVNVYEYDQLKWVSLFICFFGFYISGLINRKTSLKLIPFLYISLLFFIPLRGFYFPLTYFLVLFATIGLLLTRKEVNHKVKRVSLILVSSLFVYFLFSQPLILREGDTIKLDKYGGLKNGKTIWNFSNEKNNLLPESVFLDSEFKPVDLKSFENKTLYISFWATWCEPCFIEKPELEKLKVDFKDNSNVVFVDISLDGDEDKWKKFVEENEPSGIQLISKDLAKTRNLFALSGIPAHLVVNSKWQFAKERLISSAYKLLSDSLYLDNYINKTLPKDPNAIDLEDYRIVKYLLKDSIKIVHYSNSSKDRKTAFEINNHIDTIRKRKNTADYNILVAKKPIANKDSIIYRVVYYGGSIEEFEEFY
tara:strand:- start:43 stop:1227 length:1185 start_codon:yes stop_codon:yes gene_type:complete